MSEEKTNNNANASTPRVNFNQQAANAAAQPAVVSPLGQRRGAIRVNNPANIGAAARRANAAARGQENENAAGQENANAAGQENAQANTQANKQTYGGKRKRSIRKTRRTLRNKNKRTRKH